MNHVIIDILQLFLRISYNLFELLIRKLGCVASVSVGLESKESQRNGIFGVLPTRKIVRSHFSCGKNAANSLNPLPLCFFAPKPHGNTCHAAYQETENAGKTDVKIV